MTIKIPNGVIIMTCTNPIGTLRSLHHDHDIKIKQIKHNQTRMKAISVTNF